MVERSGDEGFRFWRGKDGRCYTLSSDGFAEEISGDKVSVVKQKAKRKKAPRRERSRKRVGYTGQKRGLIILAQFNDTKFLAEHDNALFGRMANERGFQSGGMYPGSVSDYFRDQSGGVFELAFDVVGPVTLPKNSAYYGQNDSEDLDLYPGQMVVEACNAAADLADFRDYDWDGDGVVDQVFVLYAGMGEADSEHEDAVWPHAWSLTDSDYGKTLRVDGVVVDNYACCSELEYTGQLCGIGAFCHEFSHCLGLADMYDTSDGYSSVFGLNSWGLMDYGCYNDNSRTPAGYNSFEKMSCGWLTPVTLSEDTTVQTVNPLSQGGEGYIIYNDNHVEEYYMLENRQRTGWDSALPGSGMLILHVDYDNYAWANNEVNNDPKHPRCTIFHADNSDKTSSRNVASDTYPYAGNDSLTDTSVPKAMLYNANTDGSYLMHKAVTGIKDNGDGTMSFAFRTDGTPGQEHSQPQDGVLLYETFDKCTGTGGNDGRWGGNIAQSKFQPDLEGWDVPSGASYGGKACARFGKKGVAAVVETPYMDFDGDATLYLRAGLWHGDSNGLDIQIGYEEIDQVQLLDDAWTDITLPINHVGRAKLAFLSGGRFFIDEVKVVSGLSTGISSVSKVSAIPETIYTVDGRSVGSSFETLPRGIYIVGGRKVAK